MVPDLSNDVPHIKVSAQFITVDPGGKRWYRSCILWISCHRPFKSYYMRCIGKIREVPPSSGGEEDWVCITWLSVHRVFQWYNHVKGVLPVEGQELDDLRMCFTWLCCHKVFQRYITLGIRKSLKIPPSVGPLLRPLNQSEIYLAPH